MTQVRYVPLGGLGEIGMNMWALESEGAVLVVDAGLMFPRDEMPGIDLVVPDTAWLEAEGRRVAGIVLTHGHEDHVGGLPFVLKKINVPVYGTRLTLGLVKHRLKEHRVLREADLREVRLGERVQVGPFGVEFIAVCHSIPDAAALAITTPAGRIVYTSDFKLDLDPLYGPPTDLERFRRLGDEGVHLLLSDSTNAERPGHSGSERDLVASFEQIFEEAPGRIVVSTFASNIHRVQQVVSLAARHGRRVSVIGRSLQNAFRTARELGYLEVPENLVVRIEDAPGDREHVLLCAGTQGEPLSALARFAAGRHPLTNVRAGDRVVISARPIPGNERLVSKIVDNLFRAGARVHYSEIERVHVSGHAQQDELREMIEAVRPRHFIPVHGEYRQLHAHAEVARRAGLPESRILVVEDGHTVDIDAEGIRPGPPADTGYVFVDGIGVGDVEHVVLRDRRRLAGEGVVVVALAVDRDTGTLQSGPDVVTRGFIEEEGGAEVIRQITERAARAARSLSGSRSERTILEEAVHDAVAEVAWRRTRRRPLVVPVITEV